MNAFLILEDGTVFEGKSIGSKKKLLVKSCLTRPCGVI